MGNLNQNINLTDEEVRKIRDAVKIIEKNKNKGIFRSCWEPFVIGSCIWSWNALRVTDDVANRVCMIICIWLFVSCILMIVRNIKCKQALDFLDKILDEKVGKGGDNL